ncbi:hypothetical protein SISNIDRAFT_454295 [Sistotremastrum niveocremeum HHB9708]|uniref:Uncharacterized protein n=1 Tax=Sistotremastrum niveocremeum HHB9708 TaxID=1314777 RepID=A0A164V648_9AGAM|nr:hypothetical protein SISNIDRAFT_454295 [Sistotremastrum niveocremeum HHB9708]
MHTLTQCEARDYKTLVQCLITAECNSKWCSVHEEQEGKQLRIYKSMTTQFEAFDDQTLCLDVKAILSCTQFQSLKDWYASAKEKWVLGNRAYQARERHHVMFYKGGDESHCRYLAFLTIELRTLEVSMEACDRRLYNLILEEENISWLANDHAADEIICAETTNDLSLLPTPPQTPPKKSKRKKRSGSGSSTQSHSETSSEPDSELSKRHNLIASLSAYVSDTNIHTDDPKVSAITQEINSNIIRTIISRNPSLFMRARSKNFPDVISFLQDDELRVSELERLLKKVKNGKDTVIGPEMIRNAIADCFRDKDEEGVDRVLLCGNYLWSKPVGGAMSQEAWEFFHRYCGCAGCALSVTRTFGEWMHIRRYSVVGPRYPRWVDPKETMSERIFRAVGACLCWSNDAGQRKLERMPAQKGRKIAFWEKQGRHWGYFKFSQNDPKSKKIISALASDNRFLVLARNPLTNTILHDVPSKHGAWTLRARAPRCSRWTVQTFFTCDVFESLSERSPEKRFKKEYLDVYDVLVMHEVSANPYDEMPDIGYGEFLERVAEVAMGVLGVGRAQDLFRED